MYSHVFVAGTFDTVHRGHEAFLMHGFDIGNRVTVGLTSDEFVRRFKSDKRSYVSFTGRKKNLVAWLAKKDFENRVTVVPIDDPYEPAASLTGLDALLVTRDNRGRGDEINKKRAARGLPELTIVEVPMVGAQDTAPISATRIANGEINRAGRLIMPDNLRPELARPLGTVLVGDAIGSSIEDKRNGIIIAVGDMTTKTLLTAGVVPALTVVDFHVARKPFPEMDGKLAALNIFRVHVTSGPGFIAREAIELIQKWSTHPTDKTVMAVAGEEDLLALPAIAYGPLGCVVFYGQPDKGLVEVVVSPEKKNEAHVLLKKFEF